MRLIAFAAVTLALLAAACAAPPPEPTFALIGVGDGLDYVLDSGLSARDCRGAELTHNDMRFARIYCELENVEKSA